MVISWLRALDAALHEAMSASHNRPVRPDLTQHDVPELHPSGVETIVRLRGRYLAEGELDAETFIAMRDLMREMVKAGAAQYRLVVRDDIPVGHNLFPGNFTFAGFWPYADEPGGHVGEIEIGTPGNRSRTGRGLWPIDSHVRQQMKSSDFCRPSRGGAGVFWRKSFELQPANVNSATHAACRQMVWLYEDVRDHPLDEHDLYVELWDLENLMEGGDIWRWEGVTGLSAEDLMVMNLGALRGPSR